MDKDKNVGDEGEGEGNKDSDHPIATSIAITYNISTSKVTGYFCWGYGFGQIILALQTGQMNGVTSSISDMPVARESGIG